MIIRGVVICRSRFQHKISERGFSLIELLIVIAIIGIILSIASIGFNQWMVKSRVEAQVRKMAADISELRIRALTSKQRHSVTFNATSYVFRSYSSESELLTAGTIIPSGTNNVSFRLKKASNVDYDGLDRYEIDTRGMLQSSTVSVYLDYNGSAAIDCFNFQPIRVNAGKKNAAGDTCNAQ